MNLAVGGLPGCFGFLAALLSNCILNWCALAPLDSYRYCLVLCNVFLMGLVLMTTYSPNLSVHFERNSISACGGAYIVGIFLSMILLPTTRPKAVVEAPGSYEKI